MGTDVAKYQKQPQNFSRDQVISHLGEPSASNAIVPSRRGSVLTSTTYSNLAPFTPGGDDTRIGRVDRHDLKAPIRTYTDEYAAAATGVYAGYTLGLSELYFAPSFLTTKLNESERSFYVFYDERNRLITSALSPIQEQKKPNKTEMATPRKPSE